LLAIVDKEYKQNKRFIVAFSTFTKLCQEGLDPHISPAVINEMLVQHLLTERLFRAIFANPDFVHCNVIAAEIEKVIEALTSRSFNSQSFSSLLIASMSLLREQRKG
jgi:predicted helicase